MVILDKWKPVSFFLSTIFLPFILTARAGVEETSLVKVFCAREGLLTGLILLCLRWISAFHLQLRSVCGTTHSSFSCCRLATGLDGVKIENKGRISTLTFFNVSEKDYGNYTCVATNKLGNTNASITLYGECSKPGRGGLSHVAELGRIGREEGRICLTCVHLHNSTHKH